MFAVPMYQYNRGTAKGESAMISYLPEMEHEMMEFSEKQILRWIDSDRLFRCVETSGSDVQKDQQGETALRAVKAVNRGEPGCSQPES